MSAQRRVQEQRQQRERRRQQEKAPNITFSSLPFSFPDPDVPVPPTSSSAPLPFVPLSLCPSVSASALCGRNTTAQKRHPMTCEAHLKHVASFSASLAAAEADALHTNHVRRGRGPRQSPQSVAPGLCARGDGDGRKGGGRRQRGCKGASCKGQQEEETQVCPDQRRVRERHIPVL